MHQGAVLAMRYLTGAGLIMLAGVVWSIQGVLIRQLDEAGSWAVLFWRSSGMVPVLVLWIGPGNALPALRQVSWAGVMGGLGLVLAFGGAIVALQSTTVANAMLLFSASPFFAAVFGRVLLKEPVSLPTWGAILLALVGILVMVGGIGQIGGGQVLGMAISYCGVALVFGLEAHLQGAHTAWGVLLVFLSAASYAVYLVYSGEMVQRLGSLRLVGLATSVACLCCLLQFVVLRPLSAAVVAPEVLWLSVLNATLCTAAPVLMVMMAIERIGAGMAAQTGMVGPLSTILMGVWILGEPFTAWMAAGTALVVAGIFVFTRMARRPAR